MTFAHTDARESHTGCYLPRRRRWTRVLRSSLRCFFFAIRLRRFLTTEPIRIASRDLTGRIGSARARPVPIWTASLGAESPRGGTRGPGTNRTSVPAGQGRAKTALPDL